MGVGRVVSCKSLESQAGCGNQVTRQAPRSWLIGKVLFAEQISIVVRVFDVIQDMAKFFADIMEDGIDLVGAEALPGQFCKMHIRKPSK